MYSLSFPDMFTSSKVNLNVDKPAQGGHEATYTNLRLMLLSDKSGLYGDPYYGTNLKRVFFSQNGTILKDLVIDEIYTAIQTFMPQIIIKRSDIDVYQKQSEIYVTIRCINNIDFITDLYTIRLTDSSSTM